MREILTVAPIIFLGLEIHGQANRTLDGHYELLVNEDIGIHSAFASVEIPTGDARSLTLRLDGLVNQLDYEPNEPIDPLGITREITESLVGGQIALEQAKNRTEISGTLSLYEGFRNYSSIWINEYYRQQYGSGGIPGVAYMAPSPHGWGIDFGLRREVIPASGYLTLSFGYLRDQVAPGYEIEDTGTSFELVRSEEVLHSWTGSVGWEGVISPRMRMQTLVRLTETTSRDLRSSWNGSLNWLISSNWIARTVASAAHEDPGFESWSLSQTIEYALNERLSLSGTIRYYEDTGQIETANLVSSAAPSLSSRQAYLTFRYSPAGDNSGWALSAGPYLTRYGETGIGTERFKNLYTDRDWWWMRFSFQRTF